MDATNLGHLIGGGGHIIDNNAGHPNGTTIELSKQKNPRQTTVLIVSAVLISMAVAALLAALGLFVRRKVRMRRREERRARRAAAAHVCVERTVRLEK